MIIVGHVPGVKVPLWTGERIVEGERYPFTVALLQSWAAGFDGENVVDQADFHVGLKERAARLTLADVERMERRIEDLLNRLTEEVLSRASRSGISPGQ